LGAILVKIVLGGKTGFGEVLTPFSRITSCNVILPKILFHARVQFIILKKIIFTRLFID